MGASIALRSTSNWISVMSSAWQYEASKPKYGFRLSNPACGSVSTIWTRSSRRTGGGAAGADLSRCVVSLRFVLAGQSHLLLENRNDIADKGSPSQNLWRARRPHDEERVVGVDGSKADVLQAVGEAD